MSWELATTIVGGFATLAVFSFLIKENPFYRFFEHLFIGIATGIGVVVTARDFLYPKLIVPMCGLDVVVFPDGTFSQPYNPWMLAYIFPMLFGLTVYCIYSKRHGWIAKLSIGFMLGLSSGAQLESFVNGIFPQVLSSFKPLVVLTDGHVNWFESLSNAAFLFSLITVMIYFFFSFRTEGKSLSLTRGAGRWVMMVCFGAYFGSTVMARMALVVERLQFLTGDWASAVGQLF